MPPTGVLLLPAVPQSGIPRSGAPCHQQGSSYYLPYLSLGYPGQVRRATNRGPLTTCRTSVWDTPVRCAVPPTGVLLLPDVPQSGIPRSGAPCHQQGSSYYLTYLSLGYPGQVRRATNRGPLTTCRTSVWDTPVRCAVPPTGVLLLPDVPQSGIPRSGAPCHQQGSSYYLPYLSLGYPGQVRRATNRGPLTTCRTSVWDTPVRCAVPPTGVLLLPDVPQSGIPRSGAPCYQ